MEYKNQDLQDMLSRHAADVAWYQSPRVLGPAQASPQELSAVLRDQVAEMERLRHALAQKQPQETPHGSR